MTDPDSRLAPFLDLATRTLKATPEIRDEARGELMARLASEADAGTAAIHLARGKPDRSARYPLLALVALLGLATFAGFQVRSTIAETALLWPLRGGGFIEPPSPTILAQDQEDFVTVRLGNDATRVLRNLEHLIRKRPDDAGLFEEYTGCHIAAVHALPPNYHETWQRIDPGNGAWLLRESMMKASTAFKSGGATGRVLDEAAFTEALELLHQAASAERFELHSADLRARRLALISTPETLAEEVDALAFALHNADSSLHRCGEFLGPLITVQAQRLTAAQDKDGVRDLISTWRRLSHGLGTRSSSLLDSVVALGFVAKGEEPLLQATIDLGMTAEKEQLDAIGGLATNASLIFSPRAETKPMAFLSGGSGLSGPPPDVMANPALFEPGRRTEYAVADRLFSLAAALLCLLLLAVAGVESIRRGKLLNGLADGLAPLLRPGDAAWTLGLGLIAPAAYYWILTRLTPFGCRDIGLLYYSPPPATLQALAGLLLMLATLVQVIRWRLSSRLGFLGVRERPPWIGWLVVGLTALLIPAIGGVRWLTGDGGDHLKALAAACGIPLLWLLWQAAVVLFVQRSGALDGVLLSRKMVLPLIGLAATLLACIPVFKEAEQTWHRQDQLGRADRAGGGLTIAEARAVRWIANRFEEQFSPP